jgi:hypothetical protein
VKNALINFRDKELIFIIVSLIVGYLATDGCAYYNSIEYFCEIPVTRGSLTDWIWNSFTIWFILKIGQGLGKFIHNCEDELQRKKDRESKLLEKKRNAVLLARREAIELGLREPDDNRPWPRFFEVDNVPVRLDLEGDTVVGSTGFGKPYAPAKALVEGFEISEEEFKRLAKAASASAKERVRKTAEALERGISESTD